jgi:hypothetical protein
MTDKVNEIVAKHIPLAPTGRSTFGAFAFNMRQRMNDRLAKYGPLHENYPAKVHALQSLIMRLDAYLETGNTSFLVDAANFAYIEYQYPSHPGAHFADNEGEDSPGRVVRNGTADPSVG